MSAHRQPSESGTWSEDQSQQTIGADNSNAKTSGTGIGDIAKLGKRAVLKLWNTARHGDGEHLKLFEVEAVAKRWRELFETSPPTLPGRAALKGTAKSEVEPGTPAPPVLLNKRQVAQRVGIAPGTLDRRIANGLFPKPLRMGKRRVLWPEPQVSSWLAEAARQNESETGSD